MSIATLETDRLYARPPAPGEERLLVRRNGTFDIADINQNGVVTSWEHGGVRVLDGNASQLLRLSGIEVPDGQMRRHHLYSGINSRAVQMRVGGVSYGCGAAINPASGALRTDRIIHNSGPKILAERHASMWGVVLAGAVDKPEIQDGEGRRFAVDTFALNETVVQAHGAAFTVDLGYSRLSFTSNARVVIDNEPRPAPEPKIDLLVHRTEEVLYVGAAICAEMLPPLHELQIDSVVTLG